mmetsp:Transcript_135018/g.431032  ORF Transcript_135018/g.431032 Transcript_135018/m.431032 type:complete len:235 (-) Transcript_135018:2316-3020(-)
MNHRNGFAFDRMCRARHQTKAIGSMTSTHTAAMSMISGTASRSTFCKKAIEIPVTEKRKKLLSTSKPFKRGTFQGSNRSVPHSESTKTVNIRNVCQKAFGMLGSVATTRFRSKNASMNQRDAGFTRAKRNEYLFKKFTSPALIRTGKLRRRCITDAMKSIGMLNAMPPATNNSMCSAESQHRMTSYSTIVHFPLGWCLHRNGERIQLQIVRKRDITITPIEPTSALKRSRNLPP